MNILKLLIKYKFTRRLIDSIVKNYFLIRKINIFFLKHKGLILEINMEDSFDRVFLFKGHWENEQIDYLINYAKKNKTDFFIDVGSNSGLYSLIFLKNIPNIKILSYEPILETFKKQLRNINLNNLNLDIELFNYALSDQNKKTYFKTKNSYNFKQSSTYRVSKTGDQKGKIKKFDDTQNILNKKIIIKIDVEGHEKNVLKGMEQTIKNNSILLQIEIFIENYKTINENLIKMGFNLITKFDSDYFYIKN